MQRTMQRAVLMSIRHIYRDLLQRNSEGRRDRPRPTRLKLMCEDIEEPTQRVHIYCERNRLGPCSPLFRVRFSNSINRLQYDAKNSSALVRLVGQRNSGASSRGPSRHAESRVARLHDSGRSDGHGSHRLHKAWARSDRDTRTSRIAVRRAKALRRLRGHRP